MKMLNLTKLAGTLGVALPLALAANPAMAETLVFDLVNDSNRVVTDFFVDGDNIANTDLYPGEYVTVSIEDDLDICVYDVVAYADTDENLTGAIDFCQLHDEGYDLVITDDGFYLY
jgi:hypothetical protein